MPVSVGIDLGTTYSAVAIIDKDTGLPKIIPNGEGKKITPSVIQFVNGQPVFGVSAEAAFNAGLHNCVSTFKRNMGKTEPYCYIDDQQYTSEDLSAMLLKHLKEEAENELGETIDQAVITVPAYFYSLEREATLNAAKRAGLKVKKIIDEPNAAAMAYGLNNFRENANILVYDLGGGTFDVTLIKMGRNNELNSIATRGDHELGGRDWDARLITLMLNKIEEETGIETKDSLEIKAIARGASESVKKDLSRLDSVKIKRKIPDFGEVTVSISKEEFENATKDLLDRTGALCLDVLSKAGMQKSHITDILLVGGSTRMPQVSKYLTNFLGKKPIPHVNPDEAVALGAAIQATKENDEFVKLAIATINGKKVVDRPYLNNNLNSGVLPGRKIENISDLSLHETTAHAMGIIAVNQEGTKYINDIIIPADHRRPVRVAKSFGFQTSSRNENIMDVYVLQGDKEKPTDNIIPYRYVIEGIKHKQEQRGKTIIKVQYTYDNHGIIHVEARQDDDTESLPIRKENVPNDMSKYGLPIDPNDIKKQDKLSIVLAVDVSYSMSGSPLDDAKDAMCKFIRDMDFSYTRVGLIAVADRVVRVSELTDDEYTLISRINSIHVEMAGIANAAHPFDEIQSMLGYVDGKKMAIILADGAWGCQSEAKLASRRCNTSDIDTAAIGFGGADQEFLNDISNTEAQLVSQSELSNAFGSIAQSLGDSAGKTGSNNSSSDTDTWDSLVGR